MTCIAISRPLMMVASDGQMTIGGLKHRSDPKLYRGKESIVGCAGDGGQIMRFMEWMKGGSRGAMPRLTDIDAVALYRDGRILWFNGSSGVTEIQEDYFAVGSGGACAISAMDTLKIMGLPVDPRVAVRAACMRDPMCAEPVVSLRWRGKK